MDLQALRKTIRGIITLPDDKNYGTERQLFYGDIDKKPAAIIKVASAEDVQKIITFSRKYSIELAIRSGGHSLAGLSSTDNGFVIDLRALQTIEVDETMSTVWAGTGLTASELTNELDKYNFVLGFGDTGSVGIGGISLGGGIGYLSRKFGLTIDNILEAEIVTADGEILRVNADSHPDLFWALRGGGGNFGVVTKIQYKLHRLGECYGGMLILPAAPEVIAEFTTIASNAPDELSTIANIMPTFPMPMIPKAFHGKLSLMVLATYAGDPKKGERILAPLRALAEPIADMLRPMRYKDMFMPENANYHPTAISHNMFINHIDADIAVNILNWLNKIEAPMKAFQFRVLGGAVERVPNSATAYAHRKKAIMCNLACFYQGEPDRLLKQRWLEEFAASVDQGDLGAYVNFLGAAQQDQLNSAYPADTLARLKQIKAVYDPNNIFKLNSNVTPAV